MGCSHLLCARHGGQPRRRTFLHTRTRTRTRNREQLQRGEELLALLDRKTAMQQDKLEGFHMGGTAVREPCPHVTKDACRQANNSAVACSKLHKRCVCVCVSWLGQGLVCAAETPSLRRGHPGMHVAP
jgi:hypothetical protein